MGFPRNTGAYRDCRPRSGTEQVASLACARSCPRTGSLTGLPTPDPLSLTDRNKIDCRIKSEVPFPPARPVAQSGGAGLSTGMRAGRDGGNLPRFGPPGIMVARVNGAGVPGRTERPVHRLAPVYPYRV